MNYNQHYNLSGKHAFLSASQYHWTNYTEDKLRTVYQNHKAKEKGTMLHDFASMAIKERIKLANHKKTLNLFVNDAIGFRMESELVLYYSDNCFGTADAIIFTEGREGVPPLLRIHDLKTGFSKASFRQLEIYAALFCLEYDVNPLKIDYILRLYQNNSIEEHIPDPHYVLELMNLIRRSDKIIEEMKNELA